MARISRDLLSCALPTELLAQYTSKFLFTYIEPKALSTQGQHRVPTAIKILWS